MGERGYLLRSKISQKSLQKQPLRKRKKQLHVRAENRTIPNQPLRSRLKNRSISLKKSFNFALKQPLRLKRKNSCMFEAEKSLNFALKQPLRSREKKTAACSRVKIAEFRSKAASSIQRETTAACSKLKFAQFRSKTTLFDPERNNSCMFEAENSLNFALKQRLRSREK